MYDYYASDNDPAAVKEIAEKHGFCLIKGFFTSQEATALERDLAMANAEFGGEMPDLYSMPSLQWLLTDTRVVDLGQALLGKTLVYYRQTNAAYEEAPGPLTENPFAEYHCDAMGSSKDIFGLPEDHSKVYPAYRFAIYFRNYRKFSGGLKVAPGSHLRRYMRDRKFIKEERLRQLPVVPLYIGDSILTMPCPPMELHNIPSEAGDLVIFNLRCFHSAGALRIIERPTLSLLPSFEAAMREQAPHLCAPVAPGSRNAIFFDFGAPDRLLDYYVKLRAHISPADLGRAFKYRNATLPNGMILRNDVIILPLAQRLLESGSLGASSVDEDAKDLIDLCRSHVEFSPAHALFDHPSLAEILQRDYRAAALELAIDIVRRRDAQNSRAQR